MNAASTAYIVSINPPIFRGSNRLPFRVIVSEVPISPIAAKP